MLSSDDSTGGTYFQKTGLEAPTTIIKEVRARFRFQTVLSLPLEPSSQTTCLEALTIIIKEVKGNFRQTNPHSNSSSDTQYHDI